MPQIMGINIESDSEDIMALTTAFEDALFALHLDRTNERNPSFA